MGIENGSSSSLYQFSNLFIVVKIVGCICVNMQLEILIRKLISEIRILDVVNCIIYFVLNKI